MRRRNGSHRVPFVKSPALRKRILCCTRAARSARKCCCAGLRVPRLRSKARPNSDTRRHAVRARTGFLPPYRRATIGARSGDDSRVPARPRALFSAPDRRVARRRNSANYHAMKFPTPRHQVAAGTQQEQAANVPLRKKDESAGQKQSANARAAIPTHFFSTAVLYRAGVKKRQDKRGVFPAHARCSRPERAGYHIVP